MVSLPPSPSAEASKRKFERMGMVVLRSTTDCAAVSSRSSSARETVISRLPVGAATSGVMVAVDKVGISLRAGICEPEPALVVRFETEHISKARVGMILGRFGDRVATFQAVDFSGRNVRAGQPSQCLRRRCLMVKLLPGDRGF